MSELDRFLETYEPEHETRLQFSDLSFTVKSNERELVERVSRYFEPWSQEGTTTASYVVHAIVGEVSVDRTRLVDFIPRPGKVAKDAYYDEAGCRVVLKKRTGSVIAICGRERYVIGRLNDHFNQLVNQIGEMFIQHYVELGYVLLHASAVMDRGGRAVVFSSESGTGKSTVALALLERGFVYLSNDRVLLRSERGDVDVVGVPKKPRVNPGTMMVLPSLRRLLAPEQVARYSAMSKGELWNLEKKSDIEISSIFGEGSVGHRGRLAAVYFLHWHLHGDGFSVEKLSPDQARELLKPNILNHHVYGDVAPCESIQRQLVEISLARPVFRVSGAVNIERMADYLKELWQS